jgi:hypothetical protein
MQIPAVIIACFDTFVNTIFSNYYIIIFMIVPEFRLQRDLKFKKTYRVRILTEPNINVQVDVAGICAELEAITGESWRAVCQRI